jgi:hypothetical protein
MLLSLAFLSTPNLVHSQKATLIESSGLSQTKLLISSQVKFSPNGSNLG